MRKVLRDTKENVKGDELGFTEVIFFEFRIWTEMGRGESIVAVGPTGNSIMRWDV